MKKEKNLLFYKYFKKKMSRLNEKKNMSKKFELIFRKKLCILSCCAGKHLGCTAESMYGPIIER